ncbi:MAG TPA: hypothetical protein PKK15_04695 [Kouleothrix sp.]|nr:hypothetical protein [Kouleothrix sp.]
MEATDDACIGEMTAYDLTRQIHALQRTLAQVVARLDHQEMNQRLAFDKITRHDNRLASHQNDLAALALNDLTTTDAIVILERKAIEHAQRLGELRAAMDASLLAMRAAIDVLNQVAQCHNANLIDLTRRIDSHDEAQTEAEGRIADLENARYIRVQAVVRPPCCQCHGAPKE